MFVSFGEPVQQALEDGAGHQQMVTVETMHSVADALKLQQDEKSVNRGGQKYY